MIFKVESEICNQEQIDPKFTMGGFLNKISLKNPKKLLNIQDNISLGRRDIVS